MTYEDKIIIGLTFMNIVSLPIFYFWGHSAGYMKGLHQHLKWAKEYDKILRNCFIKYTKETEKVRQN